MSAEHIVAGCDARIAMCVRCSGDWKETREGLYGVDACDSSLKSTLLQEDVLAQKLKVGD